jgi:6-pyruvoyltetrahydropterin/6-carboxytetrahydropterin synthase
MKAHLSRRYHFSASHRLHTEAYDAAKNQAVYGKCNNPHGHGHDYVLDVTIEGLPDKTGQLAQRDTLDDLVRTQVLAQLDHKNLNEDRPEFRHDVPTTENLAMLVRDLLRQDWKLSPKLKAVRISETERNTFTLDVSEPRQ